MRLRVTEVPIKAIGTKQLRTLLASLPITLKESVCAR